MASLFTFEDLKELVRLTGELLEKEDQIIREDFHKNPAYAASHQIPGILNPNLQDERYYQRLTWRALLPSFGYVAKLEHNGSDIALFRNVRDSPVALGQMKNWLDDAFRGVVRSKEDIRKLAEQPDRRCAQFLLTFVATHISPTGESEIDSYVRDALARMECSEKRHFLCRSSAILDKDGHGTQINGEFGVLGVLLKEGSLLPDDKSAE